MHVVGNLHGRIRLTSVATRTIRWATAIAVAATIVACGNAPGTRTTCADGPALQDASVNPGLVADCEALLSARDELAGTAMLNWSVDVAIDTWDGVTVEDNRVTELNLNFFGLTGTIPPEIGDLSSLTLLQFVSNQLTGTIPAELGELSNLEDLALWGNSLTGSIPTDLGDLSNLKKLQLQENRLTGTIPPDLGSLSNLTDLWLRDNELSGSIPAELGDLSKLDALDLGINDLTGSVPQELGNLVNLRLLRLQGNQLQGCVPASLEDQLDLLQSDLGSLPFCQQ